MCSETDQRLVRSKIIVTCSVVKSNVSFEFHFVLKMLRYGLTTQIHTRIHLSLNKIASPFFI